MTSYNIIASGSGGNAVIYHDHILVDLGIAYKNIEQYLPNIKYLLLTHRHKDHFNKTAILNMSVDYPDIVILGNADTIGLLRDYGVKNLIELDSDKWYDLGNYLINTVELEHDVENVGYRIFKKEYKEMADDFKLEWTYHKTLHATDTRTLEGIEAYDYDLYMIEFNHCEDLINASIERKLSTGEYIREYRSVDSHNSNQRALIWLEKNNVDGKVVPLHVSSEFGKEVIK